MKRKIFATDDYKCFGNLYFIKLFSFSRRLVHDVPKTLPKRMGTMPNERTNKQTNVFNGIALDILLEIYHNHEMYN